jgi:hypothetical protein
MRTLTAPDRQTNHKIWLSFCRTDDKSLQVMLRFLGKIEEETSEQASTDVDEKEVCLWLW